MDKKMALTFYRFTRARCLRAACFVSFWSAPAFLVVYLAFAAFLVRRDGLMESALFFAVPAADLALTLVIELITRRPRPYVALRLNSPVRAKGWSFPSSHASCATIIAFACMTVNPALGALIFLLAVVTALSRVGLGAHWPSDVVAAVVLSAVVAAVGFSLIPHYLPL